MRKYIIEVEETKAETVVSLLTEISVKVGKPTEEKRRYIKINGDFRSEDSFLCLTEEQFNLLYWLSENGYYEDWEEVNPNDMFEEV